MRSLRFHAGAGGAAARRHPRKRSSGHAGALAPERELRLEATLEPATRTLTGTGRLTWRNISTIRPASELRFHLYWNAWRDAKSRWMRELQLIGDTPVSHAPSRGLGSIDMTRLAIAGGADLLPRLQVHRARR